MKNEVTSRRGNKRVICSRKIHQREGFGHAMHADWWNAEEGIRWDEDYESAMTRPVGGMGGWRKVIYS